MGAQPCSMALMHLLQLLRAAWTNTCSRYGRTSFAHLSSDMGNTDSPSGAELIGLLKSPSDENLYKSAAHFRSLTYEAIVNKISSPTQGGPMPLTLYVSPDSSPRQVVTVTNGQPPAGTAQDVWIKRDGLVVPVIKSSQLDSNSKIPEGSSGRRNYYSMPLSDDTRDLKLVATQRLTGCTFVVGRHGNDIYFGHVQPGDGPNAAKDLVDAIGQAKNPDNDLGGFVGVKKSETSFWTYGANKEAVHRIRMCGSLLLMPKSKGEKACLEDPWTARSIQQASAYERTFP